VTPFVITHAGGTSQFDIYTIAPRSRSYAVEARATSYSDIPRIDGDLLEIPNVVTVRVFIDEPTLSDAYDAAYAIIADARTASQIETYEGVLLVDGVMLATIDVERPHVFLTLAFAPLGPGYAP